MPHHLAAILDQDVIAAKLTIESGIVEFGNAARDAVRTNRLTGSANTGQQISTDQVGATARFCLGSQPPSGGLGCTCNQAMNSARGIGLAKK